MAAAPEAKLTPLSGSDASAVQWTASGQSKAPLEGEAAGYEQSGKQPLTLTIEKPPAESYVLRGQMQLPEAGSAVAISVGMQTVDGKPVAHKAAASINPKGQLAVGRATSEMKEPTTAWLPFTATLLGRYAEIAIGDQVSTMQMPQAGGGVSLVLTKGAKVRDLQLESVQVPAGFFPLMMGRQANAAGASAGAGAGEKGDAGGGTMLGSMDQLKGWMDVDGVPFQFLTDSKANAIDVAKSFSGWDDVKTKRVKPALFSNSPYNASNLQIPGGQYGAIHLIAFSAQRPDHAQRLTVRVGRFGSAAAILSNNVAQVPPASGGESPQVVSQVPVQLANGQRGYAYHLRVPLANTADLPPYDTLVVQFTRDLNVHVTVPDPNEFTLFPAGQPSDVIVLAATMEKSPVEMTYSTAEVGNIFYDNQKAVFNVQLKNISDKAVAGRVVAKVIGPGTGEETPIKRSERTVEGPFRVEPGQTAPVTLDLTPGQRGWYSCVLSVEVNGQALRTRSTTLAVLAPDTRKAQPDESPFGVWCFWGAHTAFNDPDRTDHLGSLIKKGGWRWTYGGMPASGRTEKVGPEDFKRLYEAYGFRMSNQSPPHGYQRDTGWFDAEAFQKEEVPWMQRAKESLFDPRYKVLHESRSSLNLVRRYSEYLGGEEYKMPEDEAAKLAQQFENVKKYCEAIKQADPQAGVCLFNDYPAVANEFFKRGFPKSAFDVIGSESAMFMREPERQPDWMCLLGTMRQFKLMKEKYGYEQPVWFTEALYHGTNPGNLTPHQQGNIYVREAMLALANGVQRMTAAGIIVDPADDYHWSHWGATGFCYRDPDYNPKPAYPMYAWMTQILDRAKYVGRVDSDSNVLHVLHFKRADGQEVYPIWVVRGRQDVTLQINGGKPTVYDSFGNPIESSSSGNQLKVTATDSPIYVAGTTVEKVIGRAPGEIERPIGEVLVRFDNPGQLKVVGEPSKTLEQNFDFPRLKGNYKVDVATEDGVKAMRLELQGDNDNRKLFQRYVELALTNPITLKGRPYAFNVRLKGNGGWGRVMFEMQDADGRVWTSCGNQYPGATNASDCYGDSYISFDGWQTISVVLPGQYAGKDQFVWWPRNADWWPVGGPDDAAREKEIAAFQQQQAEAPETPASAPAAKSGKAAKAAKAAKRPAQPPIDRGEDKVSYPLKLTKVIIAMPPELLYVDVQRPVKNPVIYLDKLGVVEAPAGM